jgi:preprotein translocase subunit YajC
MKTLTTLIERLPGSISIVFGLTALAQAEQAPAPGASPFGGLFPLIVIFVIFYFFLIRPQQKKAKEHQQMLNAVKKDDRIVTSGGIYGTVTAVRGDTLEVKIAENVKVQIAKSAVSTVLPPENQAQQTPQPPQNLIK